MSPSFTSPHTSTLFFSLHNNVDTPPAAPPPTQFSSMFSVDAMFLQIFHFSENQHVAIFLTTINTLFRFLVLFLAYIFFIKIWSPKLITKWTYVFALIMILYHILSILKHILVLVTLSSNINLHISHHH